MNCPQTKCKDISLTEKTGGKCMDYTVENLQVEVNEPSVAALRGYAQTIRNLVEEEVSADA